MLALVSMGMCGAGSAWAQASPEGGGVTEAPAAGPPAPPVGYPPPPPGGYPPPPPGGYPPPPPGGYPPPGYGPNGYAEAAPVERTANNAIYLELLGPGILYSINYDRTFGDFAGRVGFSYISLSASSGNSSSGAEAHASFITVPLTVSYLGIGSKKHMFELGAGATIVRVGAGASTFAVDKNESTSAVRPICWAISSSATDCSRPPAASCSARVSRRSSVVARSSRYPIWH